MINKKILILGKGFIGERLQNELNCQITSAFIKSYQDAGLKKVQIRADYCCDECKKLDKKVFTIQEIIEQKEAQSRKTPSVFKRVYSHEKSSKNS